MEPGDVAEVDRRVSALLTLIEDKTVPFVEIIDRIPDFREGLSAPAVKLFHEQCRERISRRIASR